MTGANAQEIARTSEALLAAFEEAQLYLRQNGVDSEFAEILRYARELYELLMEQLSAFRPEVDDQFRDMADAMGGRLAMLEANLQTPHGPN